MGKFYLLMLPIAPGSWSRTSRLRGENTQVRALALFVPSNTTFEKADRLLLVDFKGTSHTMVLPEVTKVVVQRENGLTLETEKVYNKMVPIETVRRILNRPLDDDVTQLTQSEFDRIVGHMSGVRLKENELLDYIKRYIAARGYYFDDETLYNYHVCLKTRPLVILAGLSGTGKSKLSQLYAEAVGQTVQNKRYLRLAVRP